MSEFFTVKNTHRERLHSVNLPVLFGEWVVAATFS